jgi:hypothetical protein
MSAKQCQILATLGLDKNVTLQSLLLEGKTALVGACLDDTDENKKARFEVGQDVEEALLKAEGPVLIQDRGACAIANVLKNNNTLTELHLVRKLFLFVSYRLPVKFDKLLFLTDCL